MVGNIPVFLARVNNHSMFDIGKEILLLYLATIGLLFTRGPKHSSAEIVHWQSP